MVLKQSIETAIDDIKNITFQGINNLDDEGILKMMELQKQIGDLLSLKTSKPFLINESSDSIDLSRTFDLKDKILLLLKSNPGGLTARQISQYVGKESHYIMNRIKTLEKRGIVVSSGISRKHRGSPARIWTLREVRDEET